MQIYKLISSFYPNIPDLTFLTTPHVPQHDVPVPASSAENS